MVVSIVNISPAHGSRYYTQEGNYSESEQHQHSNWRGKLLESLGISGSVETTALTHLLHGRNPTGEPLVNKTQLHRQQENARAQGKSVPMERAGIDLTCSAPKSVSIQALVFGDRLLEEAHRLANDRMLQVLEEHYACTRIRQDGQRVRIKTGELAIAQFHHVTSRALDPQLHTHNLILNLQQRLDGNWQSLDNEAIYRARSLLGKLYRNELAKAVQTLGYEIEITHSRHEFWELKGYTRPQLEQFSKRAQQIQTVAGKDASSEEKAWITMTSGRQEKRHLSRSSLISLWQQEATVAGMTSIPTEVVNRVPLENLENNHPLSVHISLIRGFNDFQRNENQIPATPAESSTRQHNPQSTYFERCETLFDPTPIQQFRAIVQAVAHSDESKSPNGCLGELAAADSSHLRTGGTTDSVAEANASLPDYVEADVGEPAAADRGDVYPFDDRGAGVGHPDGTADSESDSETDEEWNLERAYRQSH